jgi:hypothetical protein
LFLEAINFRPLKAKRIRGVRRKINMRIPDPKFVAAITAAVVSASTAAAQAVMVVGTGGPDLDVPCGSGCRRSKVLGRPDGTFLVRQTPDYDSRSDFGRMVLVSKEVVISGTRDEHGEMMTIEGGVVSSDRSKKSAHLILFGEASLRKALTGVPRA